MDNKKKLATAHILHSQAVLAGLDQEVIVALGNCINRLNATKAGVHMDDVSVDDAADVRMKTVRKN